MDPGFLDLDAEHQHDSSVTTLSIVRPGDVHETLFNEWVGKLLKESGTDIFRMKGVLAISGAPKKFVYQAVHMVFDGSFDDDASWRPGEPRICKLVFIGKDLDKGKLTSDFDGCRDIPENDHKILAIMNAKLAAAVIFLVVYCVWLVRCGFGARLARVLAQNSGVSKEL